MDPGRPPRLPMPGATAGHFTAARPKPAIVEAIAEGRDSPAYHAS